ncbi:TonB-dependent receptor [Chroococcidiopsis sp. CCMEE 29]|uniref:TonB-dependent receptor domain-containing protein n=1 Tax=Chroococcidiopsis sp. CCMEE 29 TaxID=155894 RepID=UPI002021E446|nr:TonB-dependent receptor [Chroococcidiopsis sp. CCMEE 29]
MLREHFVKGLWVVGVGIPAAVLISYPAQAAMTQVTSVRVNPTTEGIEVILETVSGESPQVLNTSFGKTFVANIVNAQLRLPQSNSFRTENPTRGIAAVSVTPQGTNSIRVTVVGEADLPQVRMKSGDRGLIFSATPGKLSEPSPEAQTTPQTPAAEDRATPQTPPTAEQPAPEPTRPSPTQPEEMTAPESEELEIVVTAQKREENVQEIPISTTVIPQETLEDAQVNSFRDIAENTPNFSFFKGSNAFSFYSIRGLSNSNFLSRDSIGFYVDDIPFDYGFFLDQNLIDLERVEVLRGPQSTLYGRNSQAGVVNVVTRQPTNDPEVRYSASYGNYDNRDFQLSLSGPIVPDKLLFRIAGAHTARDGFTENTFLDQDIDDRSNVTGRAQLLWTPSEDWNISFNAIGSYNDDGAVAAVPLSQSNPFRTQQDFDGFHELSTNAQALKIAYEGAGARVTSITSRRFSNSNRQDDGDSTAINLLRVISSFNSTVWSQELRVQSPDEEAPLRWLIGGYYESRAFNVLRTGFGLSAAGATVLGLPAAGDNLVEAELDQTVYAGFGQLDYKPIEPLTLTAGLRYESSRTEMDRQRNFFVAGSSSAITSGIFNNVEQSGSELLPRFAAAYRFSPNLMAYGSISRGYKPGGLNYQADTADLLEFDEETGWNYELGLKSSWFDDLLTANLAVFYNPINNYQVLQSDFTGFLSRITNAQVDITGVELELKATPVEGLDLVAGFGYVRAFFSNYTNPFTGQSFDDNRVPYAPEYTYNLAVQYRSPGGLFGRVELQGFGTYFFDEANQLKQEPFALVNARIGYEGGNYGVYLFANNIFDKEYLTTAFEILQPVGTYGDRATYGIQVRANF